MLPNELIFIMHVVVALGAVLAAARWGQCALVSVVCLLMVVANIFVTQTILLCGATATSVDAFVVSSSLAVLLLQKQYGDAQAKQAVLLSFGCLVLFTLLSAIHLLYIPAPTDMMRMAFVLILMPVPRILCASVVAYGSAQLINLWLFKWFCSVMENRAPVLQLYGAIIASQIVDTLLFTLLGLYGVVANLGSVMLISIVIKIITVVVSAPLLKLVQSLRVIKL